jgi:peroxiredoxin
MASQFPPKKNTAFDLGFTLYKSDGSVIANPGTLTAKISKDFGDYADIGTVSEEDTTYGQLKAALTNTEMNADVIMLYIKDDTTGCVPFTCTLYTTANTQDEIGANVANIHDTDLPAVKTVVDTIQSDTDLLDDVSGGLADIHTDIAAVKTVVDTIQADTDLLDDAAGGIADIHTDIGTLQTMMTDIHDTDLPAVKAAVDGIEVHVHTTIPGTISTMQGNVTDILADTNELQADWTNSGRLDLILDAASAPTAVAVADAVWDELLSGHSGAGSAGLALATASSGGVDPSVLADAIWDEALSGHSTAGTAGKKLTDLTNADLSGLATAAALGAVDNFLDTEVAAIKAVTDKIDNMIEVVP